MEVMLATTQQHFADVFRIRTNVFIGEQNVPPGEEIDMLDRIVPILVAYEGDNALGTARVIEMPEGYAKIGRVAVAKEVRKSGVGRALMEAAISFIKNETKAEYIKLDAQISARKFYESLGFIAYGEIFLDAGIDHIAMKYPIKKAIDA